MAAEFQGKGIVTTREPLKAASIEMQSSQRSIRWSHNASSPLNLSNHQLTQGGTSDHI